MSAESSPSGDKSALSGTIARTEPIAAPEGLRAVQDDFVTDLQDLSSVICSPENINTPFYMAVHFPDNRTPKTSDKLPYMKVGWKTSIDRAAAAVLIRRLGADMKQPFYHALPTDYVSPDTDRLMLMEGESIDLDDVLTDHSELIGVIDGDSVERVQWVENHSENWRTTLLHVITERAICDSFIAKLIEETVADGERENILGALPAMQVFYRQYVEIDLHD